ncbi:DUF3006 domain-containing protein [Solibacillus daqui]|uniref:DUF3006 domain-containing protein n=1 Tax=Solibacillus daqui TaxID=2912187 RepID=UPI00236596FE|nr:DUF3006 domain-containing protein [Solibacillus daqui]
MSYHKKYTLDRFEGDYAIFLQHPDETKQLLVHQGDIEVEVKEGDIVTIYDNGQTYEVQVLKQETANRKQHITNLMQQLREKNK